MPMDVRVILTSIPSRSHWATICIVMGRLPCPKGSHHSRSPSKFAPRTLTQWWPRVSSTYAKRRHKKGLPPGRQTFLYQLNSSECRHNGTLVLLSNKITYL